MHDSQYDRILAILCSVLDAYSVVLFLPEQSSTEAHYVAASFSLGNKVDFSAAITEGRGLVGWILRNREPLLVANFDQRQNHLGYYMDNEEQTIKAFMGCALANGQGVLCVDSKRQYSFSEKDQKMLHLFADLLTQMCEEDRESARRHTTLKYYSALRAVYAMRHNFSRWPEFLAHFLDLVVTVTGFSYCVFCTRDAYGENYLVEGESFPMLCRQGEDVSFPMNHGIVGWVFRNGKIVLNDGAEGAPEMSLVGKTAGMPQFQTIMAVPLIIQRKTRGVLALCSEVPLVLDELTKEFIQMVCDHLALFLENLYIKCRLRDMYMQQHGQG